MIRMRDRTYRSPWSRRYADSHGRSTAPLPLPAGTTQVTPPPERKLASLSGCVEARKCRAVAHMPLTVVAVQESRHDAGMHV